MKRQKLIIGTLSFVIMNMTIGNISASAVSLEEPGGGRNFKDYYIINGKITPDGAPKVKQGITFVQGRRTAEALGIEAEYDNSKETLTIKYNNNIYTFKDNDYFYMKNDEKIYFKVVKQNGVEAPVNVRIYANGKQNDIEVPLAFFTKELGFSDKFTVDSNWCLTLGTGISLDFGDRTPTSDFLTGIKVNKERTVEQGWVCPTLKSVSRDNVVEDAKTLIKELEFEQNGSTSAIYRPQGTKGVSVGPFATGTDASHFTAIRIYQYNENSFEASPKIDKIIPQVFKFYFPNSWQKVDELYKDGNTIRYTIDGRDTVIAQGYVYMSRVNGSLQGRLAVYPSQGTIGTAYNVQTSDTGYWDTYGTQYWHYIDGNNQRVTGWKQINGKWYYFDENGRMLTNTVVNGYKIGADGVWVQ
jgi:hypothetical protein